MLSFRGICDESMATLRLKGLVSRMQRVRQQLVAGIPPNQVDEFRTHIRDTIDQVEALCAEKRMTPQHLPRPSYQAYHFFKTLDLRNLPVGEPKSETSAPPFRIRRLLQTRERTQAGLSALAQLAPGPASTSAPYAEQFAVVSANIAATVAQVEAIACDTHSHVARLPLPSRQAYAWFKFLGVPENLQLHLNTLQCAYAALKDVEAHKRYAGGSLNLTLEFYHTESEWRVRQHGNEIRATFSEGFISAEPAVIEALVQMAFHARRKNYRQIVHEYSGGEEFAETVQAIELPISELDPNVRGRTHNLQQVFDRVNRAYFEGKATLPRLTWNKTGTVHLMGHYVRATDTVMISISLDHPDVPEWAIDHIMHHELLHRILGERVVNGRTYAHTPEFRAAERAFHDYERANAFINEWCAKLRRHR